jgi:hypothetical protein
MNFKRLTLGITAALALGATPALAGAPTPELGRHHLAVKSALNHFNLDLGAERVTLSRSGREDIVYSTPRSAASVVSDLKGAYKSGRVLPNGLKVAGWAYINARGTYTFTLEDTRTRDSFVAEVLDNARGADVVVRGTVFAWRPQRAPLSQIPRRYAPVGSPTIVR